MIARDERRKLLVRGRMRCDRGWRDVCILNVSSRGLGLACDQPPPRGTYVEFRRGPFTLVAKVAWSKGHRFGVSTQGMVPGHMLLADVAAAPVESAGANVERRARPRPRATAERGRLAGRLVEYGAGVGVALMLATALVEMVGAMFGVPMRAVGLALAG